MSAFIELTKEMRIGQMKNREKIISDLMEDIKGKDILEVACGTAEISLVASDYANQIKCIDLVDFRLGNIDRKNISFEIMDASKMTYADNTFDTIIIYNAFAHIVTQWHYIEKECRRVLKNTGKIILISTWSLDLEPMKEQFKEKVKSMNGYWKVEIDKKGELFHCSA